MSALLAGAFPFSKKYVNISLSKNWNATSHMSPGEENPLLGPSVCALTASTSLRMNETGQVTEGCILTAPFISKCQV